MNKRARELAQRAGFNYVYSKDILYLEGLNPSCAEEVSDLVELIVEECTQLLFAESERLYSYSRECNNKHEAELCAEKCMDNIAAIKEHFGVKE